MKRLFYTFIVIMTFASLASQTSHAADEEPSPPYRHVVCFKFKDDATPEQITTVEKEFAKLPSKIDTITDFEWGTNVSPENHAQGYTHCFIVTFADKAGLEKYIPHPDHKKFVALLLPSLDKVFVIDFIAK